MVNTRDVNRRSEVDVIPRLPRSLILTRAIVEAATAEVIVAQTMQSMRLVLLAAIEVDLALGPDLGRVVADVDMTSAKVAGLGLDQDASKI